jgi:parallel beta-helix repeat protein
MTLRLLRAARSVATTALRLPELYRGLSIVCLCLATCETALGATYYVDGSHPACDDAGPGTEAVPYCTITAAQAAHAGAGVTIAVKPGTYDEVITVTRPGASGNPFVFQALGPGVIVNGRFTMSSRPWVTIDGFTINATAPGHGIMVGSSPNAVITNNAVFGVVNLSYYGIYASYATNLRIAGNTVAHCESHGIVIRSVSGSVIENNASHHNDLGFNFKIDGAVTTGNVIRRNRAWSNATSGFYYQGGVHDNLMIQNLAWSNGDHGVQHNDSRGNRHIGEVVWGNADDGVSIRNNSTGNSFFDCILENNSVTGAAYEILVDSSSTAEWSSDDNVIWNARRPVIKFGNVVYSTAQLFANATGNDTRTRNQYPRFLDPGNGNFRLMQDSPAIDCANTAIADWPATDFGGQGPVDDPVMSNSGIGSFDHADRGAFEFAPTGAPPVARLRVYPSGGPHEYVIDASTSSDLDGPIHWYWFSFGDGAVSGPPQSAPTVVHSYTPGTWAPTVTVVDTSGYVGTATTIFTVDAATAVADLDVSAFALGAMAPNPIRTAGKFAFTVPRTSPVRASVIDVQGRTVARLVDRVCEAGRHESSWDGSTASGPALPGLYFLRLETPEVRLGRKFLLAR